MHPFKLVLELNRPVAALIPGPLESRQLFNIYSLLPPNSFLDSELAARWHLHAVPCTPEWAAEQKRRCPMTEPKHTLNLAFL